MPVDWSRYPANWKFIRARILDRSRDGRGQARCEWKGCNAPDGRTVHRRDGAKHIWSICTTCDRGLGGACGRKCVRVVLTIAHLGVPFEDGRPGNKHDKMDVRYENLMALCQLHHLRLDVDEHSASRGETMRRRRTEAGQQELFP